MSNEDLLSALKQIKLIVDQCLQQASGQQTKTRSRAKSAVENLRPDSLPNQILALRENGFFRPAKTFNEAHAELEKSYPCQIVQVKVACRRLWKRKYLRKVTKDVNGKKQTAYVW